jgi:hypothetical protein
VVADGAGADEQTRGDVSVAQPGRGQADQGELLRGLCGPFTDAVRSPWRLYLCVTAFAERGDPYTELAGLAPDEMTGYLLAQLIPALPEQHPCHDGGRWQPGDVDRWLRDMTLSGESSCGTLRTSRCPPCGGRQGKCCRGSSAASARRCSAGASARSCGVALHPGALALPHRWKQPRLVFVNSMSDLFHATVPVGFIRDVLAVMADTSQHTYQMLTKRSLKLRRAVDRLDWPGNLWMGVSVENAEHLDRVDHLRGCRRRYGSSRPSRCSGRCSGCRCRESAG